MEIDFKLPEWLKEFTHDAGSRFTTLEERMGLAIEAARQNIKRDLEGPFGAAVFERDSGRVLSVAVNRVMDQNCSVFHAEVLAIMLAQHRLGSYTLALEGGPACELVTSCEPCAMCLGATVWSGVEHLVCGAREVDAFEVGFDEGPKVKDWAGELKSRGIEVTMDVSREEARELFRQYVEAGGEIYNP